MRASPTPSSRLYSATGRRPATMRVIMTKPTAKQELLRRLTNGRLTEDDALNWMILLHTHQIHLQPGTLADLSANGGSGEGPVLAAETQRGAAEVIASLWPDRADERANYVYWYRQYNTRTPHEVLENVPQDRLTRVLEL